MERKSERSRIIFAEPFAFLWLSDGTFGNEDIHACVYIPYRYMDRLGAGKGKYWISKLFGDKKLSGRIKIIIPI